MKKGHLVIAAALALTVGSTLAFAGSNTGGTAYLNWSGNIAVYTPDLSPMPTGTQFLYVQLDNMVELAGCEFMLLWDPPGPMFSGCYEFSVGSHPSGSGTNCAWLMRGGQVEGVNLATDSSWLVAFAGDQCNIVCVKGNVARALFDFSFCFADIPGIFCLDYLKVTDCAAVIDYLTVTGDATILGGAGAVPPCAPTAVEPATWGSIKALYQ